MNTNDIHSILNFPGRNTGIFCFEKFFHINLELRKKNEEKILDINSYVQIIKDALYLNKSVCLAKNFPYLHKEDIDSNKQKVFIDIWPVCSHLLEISLN
jgi:hypothetical protein